MASLVQFGSLALHPVVAVRTDPSAGSVIEFGLNIVTVDLGPVPIDEALNFRKQNLQAHKHYMLSVCKFAMERRRAPADARIPPAPSNRWSRIAPALASWRASCASRRLPTAPVVTAATSRRLYKVKKVETGPA